MSKRFRVLLTGRYISPGEPNEGAKSLAAEWIRRLTSGGTVELSFGPAQDPAGEGSILIEEIGQ